MNKMLAIAAAALACTGALHAHHSGSMYETTPIWVKGTVVRFERVDPHTITVLEQRGADGQVRQWSVEGPARFQLERLRLAADVPQILETLEFCAFPYKPAAELSRMFPGVDFSARRATADTDGASPRFVAGHVMIRADGQMRMWEPHGVLGECIRSSAERRPSWLEFLDADPQARQAWCDQRRYTVVQSNAPLRLFVNEIETSIDEPCT